MLAASSLRERGDGEERSHRARQHGRTARARRRALGRSDAARRAELPDLRAAHAARIHPCPGRDQACRGASERRARALAGGGGRAHRRGRGGGVGRHARRAVPDRRVPDRLGHIEQHERQRGDRRALRRRRASQRSRQPRAEFQRRDPDRDPGLGRGRDARTAAARAVASARHHREARRGIRRHRQDRPHPSDGCDAADAETGIPGLGGAAAIGAGAHRGLAAPRAAPAAGRHGHRHWHQCRSEIRGAGCRRAGHGHGRRLRTGRQPVRRHRLAGRRRRTFGPAQHAGGGADETRQRSALDELRSAGGPGRDRTAGVAAGFVDHAGQGQPGDPRSDGDGLRAGDGQPRHDHGGGATSSST